MFDKVSPSCEMFRGGVDTMLHALDADRERRERVSLDLAKRQELYGEFIEAVRPLFGESVENTEFDPAKIFGLYSILGRIWLSSSDEVLREAEEVIMNLLKWYSNPAVGLRAVMEQAARREVSDPIEVHASVPSRARRPSSALVKHSE
jgi:hypothetical protein